MSDTANRNRAPVDIWYWGVALSLALAAALPADLLQWSRPALAEGELWRSITGHWTHLNLTHLGLNLGGLTVVALLYPQTGHRLAASLALLMIALVVSAGLYWLTPELVWYRGFSGCLHGLVVYGSVLRITETPVWSLAILTLVAAKLFLEHVGGATPGVSAAIGGPVIVSAHQLGAAGGLLAGATALGYHRVTSTPPNS
ncbi:MAG: rhombosortase [Marinobacter sp.]|uniref:rhombosortase n=1 Tax=Marinobacter sp. TaxID=50741 RepID=UPI00299E5D89|nr:rhombosortase [Marinobacter sp.]MDX1755426.1 rhombosortase [Marinobacter sp.]